MRIVENVSKSKKQKSHADYQGCYGREIKRAECHKHSPTKPRYRADASVSRRLELFGYRRRTQFSFDLVCYNFRTLAFFLAAGKSGAGHVNDFFYEVVDLLSLGEFFVFHKRLLKINPRLLYHTNIQIFNTNAEKIFIIYKIFGFVN